MRANSTAISARMFRTQKIIILTTLTVLFLVMIILSVSYLSHFKDTIHRETTNRLNSYFGSSSDDVNKDANKQDLQDAKQHLEDISGDSPPDLNDST